MTTPTKLLFAGVAVLSLMGAVAFFGLSPFGKQVIQQFGAAPAGSTFTMAKTAMIVWTPSTDSASTTSILNTDADDRVIKQVQYYCTGLAAVNGAPVVSAGWRFTAATTSVANLGLQGNTNLVLTTSVATTTNPLWVASTTPGLTASQFRLIWPAGSYLSFAANASSTATCVIGVDYIGS